jgi:hypothetical protein
LSLYANRNNVHESILKVYSNIFHTTENELLCRAVRVDFKTVEKSNPKYPRQKKITFYKSSRLIRMKEIGLTMFVYRDNRLRVVTERDKAETGLAAVTL